MNWLRVWAMAGAAAVWAAAAQAQTPAWSLEARQRLQGPGAGSTLADRERLVLQAEEFLARGDALSAQQAFDRAAAVVHAADVEMGLVRAYQQAGDYRRAVGFASHAAGAHRDTPGAAALYAWLLHVGGQGVFARRVLDDARQRWPDDTALQAAQVQLAQPWPRAEAGLTTPPLRTAPYASGAALPSAARVVGNAVLAGDGRSALAPSALVGAAPRVWLRNGLGQTVIATPVRTTAGAQLTLLRLSDPLPLPAGLLGSAREPFAGSPGYAVEYSLQPGAAEAAWPLLRHGFFGRQLSSAAGRLLGIEAPPGPRGGPVFDSHGNLTGIALANADGRDRMVPIGEVAAEMQLPSAPSPAERPGIDAIYEAALRVALQLIAVPVEPATGAAVAEAKFFGAIR